MNKEHNILVVDDDHINLLLLEEALGSWYWIKTAGDGTQAFRLLEKEFFSLVITDFHLPDTSGSQIRSFVRKHFPGMPVILITASLSKGSYKEMNGEDFDEFFLKPLDIHLLMEKISRYLHESEEREKFSSIGLHQKSKPEL